MKKWLIMLLAVLLTACSYNIYEVRPQTRHTDYSRILALAPDGQGGVYLLTEGWGAGKGHEDYRFAIVEDRAGTAAALQTLMVQGQIRDTLPSIMACSASLYVVTKPRPQPASAYLELKFPPALFADGARPAALRELERDYPIGEQARNAAARRGFDLPRRGRLPFLQVRLSDGRVVELPETVRTDLLQRHGFYTPVSACRQLQTLKREVTGRESWPKIM
ncbi:hypothetical protein CO610_01300 [Lysobacteraceae bacterium NML95-0200]|nr:hypothetical protein CO610_01300 [Xanthomonadaceae bacterium NML95-0200]